MVNVPTLVRAKPRRSRRLTGPSIQPNTKTCRVLAGEKSSGTSDSIVRKDKDYKVEAEDHFEKSSDSGSATGLLNNRKRSSKWNISFQHM